MHRRAGTRQLGIGRGIGERDQDHDHDQDHDYGDVKDSGILCFLCLLWQFFLFLVSSPLCALGELCESLFLVSGCSMLVRDHGSSLFFVANFPIRENRG